MTSKIIFTRVSTALAKRFRDLVKSQNLNNSKVFTKYMEELLMEAFLEGECGIGAAFTELNNTYGLDIVGDELQKEAGISYITASVDLDLFEKFIERLNKGLSATGYTGFSSISHILRVFIFKFLCEQWQQSNFKCANTVVEVATLPYDVCVNKLYDYNNSF